MSSQSGALAPDNAYSPSVAPAVLIAKTRAVSPESLCTHHTLSTRRLAAIPEASRIASDTTMPGVDPMSVCAHAAPSTGGCWGGGGGRHADASSATASAATTTPRTLRMRAEPTEVPDWRPHDTPVSHPGELMTTEEPVLSTPWRSDPAAMADRIAAWWYANRATGAAVTDVTAPQGSGMSSETLLFTIQPPDGQPERFVARLAPLASQRFPVFPEYDLELQMRVMQTV